MEAGYIIHNGHVFEFDYIVEDEVKKLNDKISHFPTKNDNFVTACRLVSITREM